MNVSLFVEVFWMVTVEPDKDPQSTPEERVIESVSSSVVIVTPVPATSEKDAPLVVVTIGSCPETTILENEGTTEETVTASDSGVVVSVIPSPATSEKDAPLVFAITGS
jgi:hypothetical protein